MTDNFSKLAKRSDVHWLRRAWHIACGCVFICAYHHLELSKFQMVSMLLSIAAFGFVLDFKRLRNPLFNEKMAKIFRPIMRQSEKQAFTGLPFYALGLGLSILIFEPKIAEISMYYLIFADPLGSIVGTLWGTERIFPNKTIRGTAAVFFACYGITYFYTLSHFPLFKYHLIFAFLGASFGALGELIGAFNIDDNLTIPVVSSLGLTVMANFFGLLA